MKELLVSVSHSFGGQAGANVDIIVPSIPACILGNREELRQAILMLLDNATKYSGVDGHVDIRSVVAAGKVDIVIEDDGPGIPDAEMNLVFDRFYRASNTRARAPGSGLGLPIVKSIVQKNGGSLSLANRSPRGLSVRLTFPAVTR